MQRWAITTALAVTLVLAAASGAGAGTTRTTYHHLDSWKDVEAYPLEEGPGSGAGVTAPARQIGDITGLNVVHRTRTVHIAQYYRALPDAGIRNDHDFVVRASNGLRRLITVRAQPGNWAGTLTVTSGSGKAAPCPGLTYVVEYSHRRIVLDVPRTCLGNPSYVRVGGGSAFYSTTHLYADDAQGSGGLYNEPIVGSAVHAPVG